MKAEAAIIFDMDGVLADTEGLKFRAHRAALEAVGGSLDPRRYTEQIGNAHEGVIRAFLSASGLETSRRAVARYEERFQEAYRGLLATDLQSMPGAVELLDSCRKEGRRLALVTSSEGWMADIVLETLGARQAFETVVTADDVEEEKPHPEAYSRAREALGPDPIAVAVEDTRPGITSASAAGLPVIAVRHDFNRDQDFDAAAAVVQSLAPAERFLILVDEVASESR